MRSKQPCYILRYILRAVALPVAFVCWVCLSSLAAAQTTYFQQTDAKLATSVHLALGKTTLANVMTALSEQTGLAIQAEDYLQERQLIVRMDNLSAAEALSALAELNDWTWRETEKGRLLVTRAKPRPPQTVAEVAPAIQAALPRDFRRYLGIGVPREELPPPATPAIQKSIESAQTSGFANSQDDIVRMLTVPRMGALIQKQEALLFESVKPGILDGKELPYTQLLPSQQTALRIALVLEAMRRLNSTDFRVMHGKVRPDLLDVTDQEIRLQDGNTLMIGRTTIDAPGSRRYIGGGAQIPGLPYTPDPNRPKLPQIPK